MSKEELNLELDLEDLAELDALGEEVAEQEQPKEKKKGKKKDKADKKEKAPKEPRISTNEIGANEVATTMLETTGPKLRAWLRKTYPEKRKGGAWKWVKGSKELQEVIDGFSAYQANITEKKNDPSIKPVKDITPEILEEAGIEDLEIELE